MDQVKIGKFIAACRKQQRLTQAQLADRLGITDRAVSKWETGKAMPDTAIMLELCHILNITVNDLLNGEVVTMENYNEKSEQILLEMAKQKQSADKHLLTLEFTLGGLLVAIMLTLCMVAAYVQMEDWLRIVLIVIGIVPLIVAIPFLVRIEQTAGYYKCGKCGHCYIPTFGSVLMAPHIHTTRHMRCPKCNQKSWQKKVLTKE